MDFRTGSDITNLSFNQILGIDCLERFNCFSGLLNVLFERQSGQIEHDCIKASTGSVDRLGQGMRMIRVQEYREIEVLAQGSNDTRDLMHAEEVTLTFGCSHNDGDVQF